MKLRIILTGLIGLLTFSCASKPERVMTVVDGNTQGTTYHMVLISDKPLDLQHQIDSLLRVIDNSMSLYNPNSLLSRVNRNETDSLDRFIIECLATGEKISRESDGMYDLTIRPVTAAYGFAGGKATRHPNIDSLMQYVGYDKVSVRDGRLVKADPGMQLDLNSIAQGATSDYIAAYLERECGLTDYLVEVGGEIFCRGNNAKGEPWRVGIDRPTEGNFSPGADLQVKLGISGMGLATSGNYRKFYIDESGRKVVHTINARTGRYVISNLLSATILAPDATLADAYGSVLMIMGLDRSIEFLAGHPELHAYLVYSDPEGNLQSYMTPGLDRLIIR